MPHRDDEALRARIESEPDEAWPDDDPRWDELVTGVLSAEHHDALERRAEDDELTARLLESLPLPDHAEEAAVQAAVRALSSDAGAAFSWRRGVAIGLALAAALWLVVLVARPGPVDPVPGYVASWRSGTAELRAALEPSQGEAPTVGIGDVVELRLIPESDPGSPLRVRVGLDGGPTEVPGVKVNERGIIVVRGVIGQPPWDLEPGAHEVRVELGWADAPSEGSTVSVYPFVVR